MSTNEKNNPKIINAWCSYDAANSVYNLIITTCLFPIYYQAVTTKAFGGDMLNFLGCQIKNTVLYDYTFAVAYAMIILLSPILSGIADFGGWRKRFMQLFTLIGAASCSSLYWFKGINIEYGVILLALAVIGYAGSLLYYNSFLPIIATPDKHDRISAKGFSWGYAGSMTLLIINLLTIENYSFFGFSTKLDAVRFSFLEVGVWWFLLSRIAFYFLKEEPTNHKIDKSIFLKGFREIKSVFFQVRQRPVIKRFLVSFFCLSMGVQTVMLVAALFGSTELGVTGSKLIITIIIIQILGIVGSLVFSEVSVRKGNKFSLIVMLLIWLSICISGYLIRTEMQFYVLAASVGLVMGGIQSQARSTYSKLIPKDTEDTASYFSFYDITEKSAIVVGMFSFGLIEHLTGSMRNSTLALSIYFLLSLIFILITPLKKFEKEL